ncbi:hypothetical protein GALMADRAFT_254795, partial [Galerina marginata CBS 339.88]
MAQSSLPSFFRWVSEGRLLPLPLREAGAKDDWQRSSIQIGEPSLYPPRCPPICAHRSLSMGYAPTTPLIQLLFLGTLNDGDGRRRRCGVEEGFDVRRLV